MLKSWMWCVVCVSVLGACSTPGVERAEKGAPEVTREAPVDGVAGVGAVIGTLKLQDQTVTIKASASGPRFTVASGQGEVLARDLTEKEVEVVLPSIYRLFKTATATGAILDARVDLPEAAPAFEPERR